MKQFLKVDEWNIIEEGFHPDNMRASESIFSLGNGRFGQRGNFEETYSSDSCKARTWRASPFSTEPGWMVEKRLSPFLLARPQRTGLERHLPETDR